MTRIFPFPSFTVERADDFPAGAEVLVAGEEECDAEERERMTAKLTIAAMTMTAATTKPITRAVIDERAAAFVPGFCVL